MTIRNKVLRSSILPAALLALAAVTPASAQYWGPGTPPPDYSGRIPPQHVEAMVRSMGLQPVAEPRTRGPLWVTHAVDRDGNQVRVLIDSFSGRVIDVLRRPLPPQRVAIAPPNNIPQANGPMSDYEDDGPDYDYRNMPPQQRPSDWPPSRPNVQQPWPQNWQQQSPNVYQQGPNVIPYEPRSDNRFPNAPKTNTAKKKETKDKKKDATAALNPEKEKEKTPSPKNRPADAPKADLPKMDAPKGGDMPKVDTPKAAEVPTFSPDNTKANSEPQTTGAVPKASPETNKGLPPVQPPF